MSKRGSRRSWNWCRDAIVASSVLETDTIEEAVEIAKTWPGVDRGWLTVEVRPVVEM